MHVLVFYLLLNWIMHGETLKFYISVHHLEVKGTNILAYCRCCFTAIIHPSFCHSKDWSCNSAYHSYFFFTFTLTCIVTNFFLIKPTDALISQIYFCKETLTCFGQFLCPSSGVFHCTFGTGICHTGFDDMYQCWMYSGKRLIMGRGTAQNM